MLILFPELSKPQKTLQQLALLTPALPFCIRRQTESLKVSGFSSFLNVDWNPSRSQMLILVLIIHVYVKVRRTEKYYICQGYQKILS